MSAVMTLTEPIQRAEAIYLLQNHGYLGRVGFIHHGLPHVLPVNYLASTTSLVFATGPGTKLSALSPGAPVCFEIDHSEPLDHSGWSVVVDGIAMEVTDPEEIKWLNRGPLTSWALRGEPHWVKVAYGRVSGRRLPGG